ncbi:hypothetical protein BD779DRAFT_1785081 [Infundibulicybe gibba]|nr:hypothetical protein BD779DRAFT_1785081 [Infundibulicybe gibba]
MIHGIRARIGDVPRFNTAIWAYAGQLTQDRDYQQRARLQNVIGEALVPAIVAANSAVTRVVIFMVIIEGLRNYILKQSKWQALYLCARSAREWHQMPLPQTHTGPLRPEAQYHRVVKYIQPSIVKSNHKLRDLKVTHKAAPMFTHLQATSLSPAVSVLPQRPVADIDVLPSAWNMHAYPVPIVCHLVACGCSSRHAQGCRSGAPAAIPGVSYLSLLSVSTAPLSHPAVVLLPMTRTCFSARLPDDLEPWGTPHGHMLVPVPCLIGMPHVKKTPVRAQSPHFCTRHKHNRSTEDEAGAGWRVVGLLANIGGVRRRPRLTLSLAVQSMDPVNVAQHSAMVTCVQLIRHVRRNQ